MEGESLIMGLNDVAVSSGSTCTSAALEPSHVLKAMGVREDLAHGAIRFGLAGSIPRKRWTTWWAGWRRKSPGCADFRRSMRSGRPREGRRRQESSEGIAAGTAHRRRPCPQQAENTGKGNRKMATAVQITEQAASRIKELLDGTKGTSPVCVSRWWAAAVPGCSTRWTSTIRSPRTACSSRPGPGDRGPEEPALPGGTELDYRESLMEAAFVFQNPNVKRSCGCGASFVV